jgi:hypothetical protein
MKILLTFLAASLACFASSAQQSTSPDPKTCPMHDAHSQSQAQMNQRSEHAMGFSQTETTHHFLLKPDGGDIQVEANKSGDTDQIAQIRMHLQHIARAFQSGDFDIPMFVHDTVPPGVPDMKRLQKQIRYSYEDTANGGRVIISTSDKGALVAIHSFLRFQIEEHKTGDPTSLPKS